MVSRRRICVLGAGSWGTAVASTLAGAGSAVTLWARRAEQVASGVLGPESEVLVLLGPSHAEEVMEGQPTAIVLSGGSAPTRETLQREFSHANLRVYTNDDLIGVETAGALKNVLAIAAGLCDGLGLGDNAKGALLARGVAEIARVGERLGARRETFFDLARREGETVPIAIEVAAVLFEGKAPAEAMSDLMLRTLKPEWGPAPR